ncbi:hypothetical protein GCM10020255_080770 [Rhodococcus baikonurensis]
MPTGVNGIASIGVIDDGIMYRGNLSASPTKSDSISTSPLSNTYDAKVVPATDSTGIVVAK